MNLRVNALMKREKRRQELPCTLSGHRVCVGSDRLGGSEESPIDPLQWLLAVASDPEVDDIRLAPGRGGG